MGYFISGENMTDEYEDALQRAAEAETALEYLYNFNCAYIDCDICPLATEDSCFHNDILEMVSKRNKKK